MRTVDGHDFRTLLKKDTPLSRGMRSSLTTTEIASPSAEVFVELRAQLLEHGRLAWLNLRVEQGAESIELRAVEAPVLELEEDEMRVGRARHHLADRCRDAREMNPRS